MIDKNCMCRNKLQVNFFLTHFKVSSSLLCSWLLKVLLIQNSLARGAPPSPPLPGVSQFWGDGQCPHLVMPLTRATMLLICPEIN